MVIGTITMAEAQFPITDRTTTHERGRNSVTLHRHPTRGRWQLAYLLLVYGSVFGDTDTSFFSEALSASEPS